nr:chitinase 3-like [Leptinotarsa decemlineata]
MECNRHSLPLPGVYKKDKIASADKEYRCLNLKYGPDNDVTEMKQCVEVEVGEDICKYLSEHLNVKECSAPRNYLMGGLAGSNKISGITEPDSSATNETTSLATTETVSSTTTKTDSSTTTETDSSTTNETTPSATTKNASSATTKNASSATTKTPSSTTQKPNSSGIHTSSVLTLMTAVLVWIHL